jgi:NADPH:quinone reductase-like Zn-dependent oxidoreductase
MRSSVGTMRAIVQDRYGSPEEVLELRDIDRPMTRDDEVLVRVRAASVHPDVWHCVRGIPYVLRIMGAGVLKPKDRVPGTDVAGHVELVGRSVTAFRPGDEVFGETRRGHQWHNGGAYAEYVSVPPEVLAIKPAALTFEQAAAVPTSATIALQGVRSQGHVRPGQRVLVNGAGGGVGAFAVQLAKAYGADVTAVDSTRKLDMMRSIGADRVIDYMRQDFTRSGERYELIVDIPGNHSIADCRRSLTTEGTYVLIGHDRFGDQGGRWIGTALGRFFKLLVMTPFVSQRMSPWVSKEAKKPITVFQELIEAGKLTPAVDRTFPLSDVPEAIRYLAEGDVLGKIVITV